MSKANTLGDSIPSSQVAIFSLCPHTEEGEKSSGSSSSYKDTNLSQGFTFGCCCLITKSCLTLVTPWTAARQASLSFTISHRLLKFMSIESVMRSNHLIICHSLLLLYLQEINSRKQSQSVAKYLCYIWTWSLSFSLLIFSFTIQFG